ncbi:DUF6545 domain-containing protein [Micromonospora sp. NPDC048063]|uniref:DUF6545 domain-containing protein n=1 Tax=Micromonospora sp. NPDC048063 TaxID=3364256 RepID=UPI00371AFDC8
MGVDVPPGLLVKLALADYIVIDSALPALARTQTVLHEVAHLVLDHDGDALHADADPAVEAEAELAADLLYRQMAHAAAAAAPVAYEPAASRPFRLPCWPSAWWKDRRMDWHVSQLWMTLRAVSDITSDSPNTAVQMPVEVGGSRQRYRRVIEVHDALRSLRPWCCQQVHISATKRAQRYRLDPADVAAVAEAATIAVALRRRQAALPPVPGGPYMSVKPHSLQDVRAEARRLARVARALHDSPLVAAEVARWVPVVPVRDASRSAPIVRSVAIASLSREGAPRGSRSASAV